MRYLLLTAVAALASGQADLQFEHLCTYGSKHGIHPPKIANRRTVKAATGESEHPYGLGFPTGIVTDRKQRIWIADSGTASVHVFDPASGEYREIRRAGDVLLQQPSGVAIDRQGYIYVTDTALGTVFAFDPSGDFDRPLIPRKSGRLLEGPTSIAASEDGRAIYVADPPRKTILALNREGEPITTIGSPEMPIDALALSVIGSEIFALDRSSHKVKVLSAGGVLRREMQWNEIQFPSAFAFDSRRGLFFVANPRWMVIDILERDGRSIGTFGEYGDGVSQMKSVDALYVDPSGLVYAADSHNGKVLVFAVHDAKP
jgi:hypothetical protein